MTRHLFECPAGTIALPARTLVLVDREDGGNLIVDPPRAVWERSELSAAELTQWSFLVAATGRAMIDVLPVLEGGCVNYWEAGNWALNEDAEPTGPKVAAEHRRVHLHLLGRSRSARSPAWRWGEAPMFPAFRDREAWAASFQRLNPEECRDIVIRAMSLLETKYGMAISPAVASLSCVSCDYPTPPREATDGVCGECQTLAVIGRPS